MPYNHRVDHPPVLTVVLPSLEKLQKEGEVGQAKITQYTRFSPSASRSRSPSATFPVRSLSRGRRAAHPNFTFLPVLIIVTSLTAGCILVMWMGELITQRGIGNGISLMIFASIVSGLPHGVSTWWNSPDQVFKVVMPFLALGVIAAIVFIQEGQRRIPIQYAKRVVGKRMMSGGQTYLPLRVNMAGVIPVIFAASLLASPRPSAS